MRLWEEFLSQQKNVMGHATVERWLGPLSLVRFDARNLYLEAQDPLQISWFEAQFPELLKKGLESQNGSRVRIHLALVGEHSLSFPMASQKLSEAALSSCHRKSGQEKSSEKQLESRGAPSSTLSFDRCDPQLLLENYVPTNPLVHRLLTQLCAPEGELVADAQSSPAVAFNPIYLSGASGTGKTHLLMAVANALRAQGRNVLYATANTFTEQVVQAMRGGTMRQFREAYRRVDLLLFDDVHLLGGKSATQEEFFHTFNTLHLEGKQLLITGLHPPQELAKIEPRLISRFEWGIALSLPLPDPKTLRAILEAKLKSQAIALQPAVQEFLLEKFSQRYGKSLCAAFDTLKKHWNRSRGAKTTSLAQMTVGEASYLLQEFVQEMRKSAITEKKILSVVSARYGVAEEDLLGKGKSREQSVPRQLAMYLCRDLLKMPYKRIGDVFSRDHSTVIAGIRNIEESLASGPSEVVASCRALQALLSSDLYEAESATGISSFQM